MEVPFLFTAYLSFALDYYLLRCTDVYTIAFSILVLSLFTGSLVFGATFWATSNGPHTLYLYLYFFVSPLCFVYIPPFCMSYFMRTYFLVLYFVWLKKNDKLRLNIKWQGCSGWDTSASHLPIHLQHYRKNKWWIWRESVVWYLLLAKL